VLPVWGVSDFILNPTDSTVAFMQDVLSEVLALFPGPYIHIGGDEAGKAQWKANPQIQARITALGLKDEHEMQSWFIRQMDTFLTAKGRRLIGWDEILEGGLAENATVMSWRGMDGGIAAAKANHDVVMAPGSHTYFDHYQSRDTANEPLAIGGFTPLGLFSLTLQPLRIHLTDVPQVALDTAVFLKQLSADFSHLGHDRVILFIDCGFRGHGLSRSGVSECRWRGCACRGFATSVRSAGKRLHSPDGSSSRLIKSLLGTRKRMRRGKHRGSLPQGSSVCEAVQNR
jgi:hypothetical protein